MNIKILSSNEKKKKRKYVPDVKERKKEKKERFQYEREVTFSI